MKVVKHPHVVKLYEVLASRTKVRRCPRSWAAWRSRSSLTLTS